MGNKKIKEWHLITPEYTNKLLNSHCRKKEQEYREKNLSHIDAEFTVLVKDYRDFICEITRHSSLMNLKLEISLDLPFEPNWEECTSSHTGNLRRKIRNLFISYYEHIDEDTIKEKVDKVVGKYIFYYQRGLKVLNNLEDRYPEQYEKFKSIKSSQGENVEMECMFPPKSKKELLDKIQDNLLNELKDELGSVFGNSSLEQLSKQIVAEWLMICPLDFGGE